MHIRRKTVLVWLFGWLVFFANPSVAVDKAVLDLTLSQSGWNELELPGKSPNRFQQIDGSTISVHSSASVSVLYRALQSHEVRARNLTWRWRVDESVPPTDPADKGGDDRNLAVHVWFADENVGLWKSLKSTVTRALGYPQIGKVLTYTFGGTGDRLRRLVNPHHDPDGMIILLRPSGTPLDKWYSERVDFYADYEQAFGEPPTAPRYLAISSDSDDTQTRAQGLIADLAFDD